MKRIAILVLALMALTARAASAGETMMPAGHGALYSDGWIYYGSYGPGRPALCKVRTDGTDWRILAETGCSYLTIRGDTIYFKGDEIYSIGTDGAGLEAHELMAEFGWWYGSIYATEEYIYIGADDPGNPGNYMIHKYTADPWTLVDSFPVKAYSERMEIADGWIYMMKEPEFEDNRFYRVRTDGTGFEKCFAPDGSTQISMWEIEDGWMYYNLADTNTAMGQLWRERLDESEKELLLEGFYAEWIMDGWVYGMKYADEITVVGENSWNELEEDYYERYGAFRVSLKTGEEQRLDGRDHLMGLIPAGGVLLFSGDAWGDKGPALLAADGALIAELPMPPGTEDWWGGARPTPDASWGDWGD